MASTFTQQSPGVEYGEYDLTNVVGSAGNAGGAFVGDFEWGPADAITQISNEIELESQFYKPTDKNYVDWFSAANFLSYTGFLNLVRAIDDNALNSTDDGTGILIKNDEHFEIVNTSPSTVKFAARCPGAMGDGIGVFVADSGNYATWKYKDMFDSAPSTSPWAASVGAKNDELHVVIVDMHGKFSGTVGAILESYPYLSKASDSKDANNAPNYYINRINKDSSYVYALNPFSGADLTDATNGIVQSITVDDAGTGYTTATVSFSFPDSGVDRATGTATIEADGTISAIVIDNAGSGYYVPPTITITGDGTGAKFTSVLGTITPSSEWGIQAVINGVPQTYMSLATQQDFNLTGGQNSTNIGAQELIQGLGHFTNSEEVDVSLLFLGAAGGETESQAVIQWAIDNISDFRKDILTFFSPNLSDILNKTKLQAANNIVLFRHKINRSTSFAVMDSGWKLQYDKYNDKYRMIPLNADLAGLCAHIDNAYDPWNSPGGYTRGKIKNVVSLIYNPDKASRDIIYKVGINPVVTFNTDGTILYGDKTLLGRNSAFGQIGTRRLFNLLEKTISNAAKYFLFETNNTFTRASFVNMVSPYLDEYKGRGGIDDFRIVCDESNNTKEVIMNKQFVGTFFIKPTYSINWIRLNFVAIRQDVEFDEAVSAGF